MSDSAAQSNMQGHANASQVMPLQQFHVFMDLGIHLRREVYEAVLVLDKPVLPSLCKAESSGDIKFHDDNQDAHDAMSKHLAITRVSKQVRTESLPIFYHVNTFAVGMDTLTYFKRLSQLGQFDMIRRVTLPIHFHGEAFAVKALSAIHKVIKDQEEYLPIMSPLPDEDFDWCSADYATLANHPAHLASGIQWVAPFLIMLKLSSAVEDSLNHHQRQLVLHVPANKMQSNFKRLDWFRTVADALGLKLSLVEVADTKVAGQNLRSGLTVEWIRRFQKKAVRDEGSEQSFNAPQILDKIMQLFPNHNAARNEMSYYRRPCAKVSGFTEVEWFKLSQ